MTKINDHTTSNSESVKEWAKVPVGSNAGEEVTWDTLSSPGVWPDPSTKGVSADRQKALDHCRQYPEQWEVLEPHPENALEALRSVHQSLNTRYTEGSAPAKSIILVMDEVDLHSEDDEEERVEMIKLLSHLARMGRSRGVHVLLGVSTPASD